jgi:hypothetical protein
MNNVCVCGLARVLASSAQSTLPECLLNFPGSLHPRNKAEVGRRLALQLAVVEGLLPANVAPSGPAVASVLASASGALLRLQAGLTSDGVALVPGSVRVCLARLCVCVCVCVYVCVCACMRMRCRHASHASSCAWPACYWPCVRVALLSSLSAEGRDGG